MIGALLIAIFHCIMVICHGIASTQTHTISTNQMQSIPRNTRKSWTCSCLKILWRMQSKYVQCLSEFKEGDEVLVLSECSHILHVNCINERLKNYSLSFHCRSCTWYLILVASGWICDFAIQNWLSNLLFIQWFINA